MAGIRLEFAQFGHFDSFDIIRSMTSMVGVADVDLPAPITTGLKTMYYVDTNVVKGVTYYYKVRVWRGAVNFISDEIGCLAGYKWSPVNLINKAKIWFNANNVVNDSNGKISNLLDISENGFNFTQSSDPSKPTILQDPSINSKVINFDGIDDFFVSESNSLGLFNNVSDAWVLCVVKRNAFDSTAKNHDIFSSIVGPGGTGGSSGGNIRFEARLANNTNINKISFGGRRLDADSYTGNNTTIQLGLNYEILLYRRNYSIAKGYLYLNGSKVYEADNGTAGLTSATNANFAHVIGADASATGARSRFCNAKLAEILIGNNSLTDGEIDKLFGWLAHKYGLTGNLPSDHPYKTVPPLL